ncbi:hypothetical protein PanWU01x14_206980 [Parasponia andersonii]|uniref:Uncharacterized protein n=1 Tax=Parasponia andersonii TaxID=3476 RepID=A0A2P5BVB8_PARAD|nr:hypothetical protein PanWU01x14_206980 [Parasponia andersonii]
MPALPQGAEDNDPLETFELPSRQSDPNHDSWRSEAPRVFCLGIATHTSTVVGVRSPKGLQTGWRRRKSGHGSTEEITEISARYSKKDLEVKGSHPCLSDLAWSSDSFEIARTREQLENPASAVGDTWTTGEKPLQHFLKRSSCW